MNKSNEYSCTGIAYKWLLAHTDISAFDVVFSISFVKENFKIDTTYSENQKTWTKINPQVFTYHAKLPHREIPIEQSDVSGTLGLLWPASDKYSKDKAAAFERLVSDSIIWGLSKIDFSKEFINIILIQGPLLPKLRGRLLYRALSDTIVMYTVTYQPEWFNRLEAAQTTFSRLQKTIPDSHISPIISPTYPPKGIDSSTRSWIAISSERKPYHFEVISNTWDCCNNPEWLVGRQEEIKNVVSEKFLCKPEDNLITLPGPLAIATKSANENIQLEEKFMVFLSHCDNCIKENIHPFKSKELEEVKRIFEPAIKRSGKGISPDNEGSETLKKAAAVSKYERDINQFYSLFKDSYLDPEKKKKIDTTLKYFEKKSSL